MFGKKESKEEKAQRELQEFMDKYQLSELTEKDAENIRKIAKDLAGTGFIKAGLALSFSDPAQQAQIAYQSAMVEQNWMIIRLLSEITSKLEK